MVGENICHQERKLSVEVVTVSLEENGTQANFTHQRSIPVPEKLSSLFTRFDVLQLDKDHVVLSGNWSTKTFLVVDWKCDKMAIYRSSNYWRVFHWRLLDSKLFIVHDDGQLDIIDVQQLLNPDSLISPTKKIMTLPNYRSIRFIHQDTNVFSILVIAQANDGNLPGAPIISHFQVSLDADGKFSLRRGHFDGLLFALETQLYLGSMGIISKEASEEATIWSIGETKSLSRVSLCLPNLSEQMEFVDLDLQSGMIALKGSHGASRTPKINLYWIL